MITIFNNKLNKSILINDKDEIITFIPKQYDTENPHILIELKGIDLFQHSNYCEDCKAFLNALGTNTHDWYININNKIERLNLQGIGRDNQDNTVTYINSYFFLGTKLKLNIDTDTIDILEKELEILEQKEEYEKCYFIRDKIRNISDFGR